MISRALTEPSPLFSASVPAKTTIGTDAVLVLATNQGRKGFRITNTGTTVLKFACAGTPAADVYHVALAAAGSADNGTGGVWEGWGWIGPIYGLSSGSGGTCVILEFGTGNPQWGPAMQWGDVFTKGSPF